MSIRRRPPNPAVDVKSLRYQVKVPNAEPRHILEEIVWQKEKEVAQQRERLPLSDLQQQVRTAPPPRDFCAALRQSTYQPALIAEVKKASPSKGVIREDFDPVAIATAYERAGAACISVLTDAKFFQGSFENLKQVRRAVGCPVLCKEFIIYPYQMYQARVHGADAVLLIAAILSNEDLQYFIKIAHVLGLTPLVEVHTLGELDRVLALSGVSLVGINNRNLETFSVHLETTEALMMARRDALTARDILVVSESGLHVPADVARVRASGAGAVLVGESLVKQANLEQGVQALFEA
ncbi:MAG: indole-3-glycerol phosphate synthase TrpC [Elainellaceae cyanobacterium]